MLKYKNVFLLDLSIWVADIFLILLLDLIFCDNFAYDFIM